MAGTGSAALNLSNRDEVAVRPRDAGLVQVPHVRLGVIRDSAACQDRVRQTALQRAAQPCRQEPGSTGDEELSFRGLQVAGGGPLVGQLVDRLVRQRPKGAGVLHGEGAEELYSEVLRERL